MRNHLGVTTGDSGRSSTTDPLAVIEAFVDRPAPGLENATAAAMLDVVGPLFRGRALAIERGAGSQSVALGQARLFSRVRVVDASSPALAAIQERAAQAGIGNIATYPIDAPWDEPTGAADYIYALELFRRIEDKVEAASTLQRISMALHRGGLAHLRFDTRPLDVTHRVRQRLPAPIRGSVDRDMTRPVRRRETWVRDRMRGADLEIIGERGAGTASHWVVARRR
jgi:hypothetical protein